MDTRTLCLAVLLRGDASGYEIKKEFEDGPFSHFQLASFGAIYPALSKLAADGLVTVTEQEQDGRPDKKVYRITESGRAVLVGELHKHPHRDRYRSDFLFMLFFADCLAPQRIAELIDERRDFYRETVARMDDCDSLPTPGHAFVHGFGRAVYAAAADYLETNRDAFLETVETDPSKISTREAAE